VKFDNIPGATPLPPDAEKDLKRRISTQGELNTLETLNIQKAREWVPTSRIMRDHYPSVKALLRLHREMFDLTWKWAGKYRNIETTIGLNPYYRVPMAVIMLCNNTRFWIENNTFPWDELGVRFHHRLVEIHPFNNGNGRHAREATDALMMQNGQPLFTWGPESLAAIGNTRATYITALQAADGGDYAPLMAFVRT